MLALGCVVPGLSTPAAAPPPVSTPTTDNQLPTLVAEMVYSALTQTAQAIPPTSTSTSTPEPPTPTATSTATPPVGSSLTIQGDNSTFFTDERAGYTILIPAGWLVVRANQPEFFNALSTYQSSNLPVYEVLKKIENDDQGVLRLFAIEMQDQAVPGEPIITIKLILDETRGISFNSDQDLQAITDGLVQTTPGMEVIALDILIPPAGTQFGVIESTTIGSDDVTTYEKRVYFNGKTGMVYAWLTTGETSRETIIPAFDAIMDTIKMLAQ
jgi:hypothetical protein